MRCMESRDHPDWALVMAAGGPEKVAELIASESLQRVLNWRRRGIPPAVKLQRPDLFLPELRRERARRAAQPEPKAA